jgi:hypothetical protein
VTFKYSRRFFGWAGDPDLGRMGYLIQPSVR